MKIYHLVTRNPQSLHCKSYPDSLLLLLYSFRITLLLVAFTIDNIIVQEPHSNYRVFKVTLLFQVIQLLSLQAAEAR